MARGRTLVIAAVGFLVLDAALLLMAGAWTGRAGLTMWGLIFGAGAVGVVGIWRRWLRNLVDIEDARSARSALTVEIERLRRSAGLPAPTGRRAKLS